MVLETLADERPTHLGPGYRRRAATGLAKLARPQAHGVALDFSPPMLAATRERFAQDSTVTIVDHNLNVLLLQMGEFHVVLSSFAIHHLDDERKFALSQEVLAMLEPGGLFCNLEHVSSPTLDLHADFYRALGLTLTEEDSSNQCKAWKSNSTGYARLASAG